MSILLCEFLVRSIICTFLNSSFLRFHNLRTRIKINYVFLIILQEKKFYLSNNNLRINWICEICCITFIQGTIEVKQIQRTHFQAINISIIHRPDLLSSDEIKLSIFRKQNTSYINKLINKRSNKKSSLFNRVWFCI